jgi:serine/threonine protein kinase
MDGKLLAAKELEKRRFMKNGQLDKRISNEMKIMESLEHPNIIKFTEYHDQGDFLYIIMEYAPYGDLQKYLGDRGPINEDIARPLAQQILAALHYLHRAKITHRDIKPDNILISSLDPFEVKISDFGLSKIVPHAETFLKTFCGTLLYCAPEVFPDFHNSGTKRRRGVKQYNAYSQSVDVWSFGGVLWFALCGEPPFRGVADATGEGMYNNIMSTTLDPTPLRKRNVSQACIDLLTMMLTTDPSERPTELECLAHPWLKSSGANAMITADPALQSIIEEEEEECDGPEQKLSQLSLREEIPESDDESDYLSDDDFHMLLDSRQSKRVRTDPLFPRDQGREYEGYDASVIPKHVSEGSLKLMPTADKQRLFGEIGQSALQSSGVLNVQAPAARAVPQLDGGYTSASLSGTESMVRELNMTSPQSPGSGPHTPNEPATPKTPEVAVSQHNSLEYSSKKVSQDSEPTPRARLPILTRQITLPKTPSLYWDPYDKKTHTLEYASEVSGFDFVSAQRNSTAGSSVTEDTKAGSSGIEDATRQSEGSDSVSDSVGDPSQTAAITTLSQISAELNVPPRRLGRLSATSDSFTSSLVLDIDRSRISWGRLRSNTNIYEDSKDTRIPKAAFVIFWWSSQADLQENVMELSQAGKDWTELSDLHVGIFTCATSGIAVNGKHIRQKDGKGRAIFGELHTGDIIQVYHDSRSAECLKFKCEFYLGLGKEPRASGTSFMALHGTKHLE